MKREQMKEKQQEKFMTVYEKYRRLIKYIAVKMLSNETLAEDAMQDSFIKIFRFIDKIEDINSPKARAFVVCIAENCCKDLLKTEKRNNLRKQKLIDDYKNENDETKEIESEEIFKLLDDIPETYRTVLMLNVYYDLSIGEIAQILNISNQNVRKRLERARKYAKEILKKGVKDYETN